MFWLQESLVCLRCISIQKLLAKTLVITIISLILITLLELATSLVQARKKILMGKLMI